MPTPQELMASGIAGAGAAFQRNTLPAQAPPAMGVPGQMPLQARDQAQLAQNQARANQLRAQNMPGASAGLGQARQVPPGGAMAAQGFKPRPPMGQMPRAGMPGGGMAAAGARPPARPTPGAGMKPAAPQAGPFGQPTKFPTMQGSFGRNSR